MKRNSALFITKAAVIAALYFALSMLSNAVGLCSGVIQCRVSEALTILPAFLVEAIPGLAIGCLLTNIITSATIWDIIFGTGATLIGAIGTYLIGRLVREKVLSPSVNTKSGSGILRIVVLTALFALPPIVSNAIIIPPVLKFALGMPDAFWFILVTVTAGEVIACGIFGGILMAALLGNPYTRGLLRNDGEVKAEAVTAEAQR